MNKSEQDIQIAIKRISSESGQSQDHRNIGSNLIEATIAMIFNDQGRG